ncbi:MAG TPA: Na/Pi cotransporter family protein [Candidatus Gallimonas intestinigallinarum]|uniref:Na/Pi cotransporter family protein n=1 Tax=Candidatus Gallimonas intestinigallinarum TaxID=2838604 RepID=A0A9D2IW50_9FIRM|nr:Na/Pi cotransporter family protein [Candidatus Gallimonas intestinigallinarum]
MEYLYLILQLLGGLGAFLAGMEIMSDSMSRLAHGGLKRMLNRTANNRFAGVGIGAASTMIIQSSSATTVMVVGLVNAGILTLFQATAIIMGANIGTTITAWIASLGSLNVSAFLLILSVIGVFMTMLSKKEKVKTIGNVLTGLGLIFVGLAFMSDAMDPNLHREIMQVIKDALSVVQNPALLLLIGIVATGIVQSSSAVTSIVVVLATSGVLIGGTGDGVYYVIIGSNIGTCITALLSSIGASPNARRAAIIHLLFNCLGAVIFMTFLLCWIPSGTTFSKTVLETIFPPAADGKPNYQFQIAFFHTLFNVTCTCLFLPFIKGFVWLANHLIRDKKPEPAKDEVMGGLDERLLLQPSVALSHLYQETGKMLAYAKETLDLAFHAFLEKNTAAKNEVLERNRKLSEANKEAVQYLVKISASAPTIEDEKAISSMHYVLNDIVRIGELADNVTKYTDHYVNDPLVFSSEFLTMIREMYEKLTALYDVCYKAFEERDYAALKVVDEMEDTVDKMRRELVNQHIKRLNEGRCQPQNSSVFINLVGNLERAADHMTYIAHSIE